jgi:hypothetical protein
MGKRKEYEQQYLYLCNQTKTIPAKVQKMSDMCLLISINLLLKNNNGIEMTIDEIENALK